MCPGKRLAGSARYALGLYTPPIELKNAHESHPRWAAKTNAFFRSRRSVAAGADFMHPGLQPVIAWRVANQELIVGAALARDGNLAFQAILGDPTNRLPEDEPWSMFLELLLASREYPPGWTSE